MKVFIYSCLIVKCFFIQILFSQNNFTNLDSAILNNDFGTIHSVLIIEKGKTLFEKYYNDWLQDSVHQLQSATKSVIATLLGIAIQQGFVKSTSQKISEFYPFIKSLEPTKSQITIEDLLTQRHGLAWTEGAWEDPKNTWRKVLSQPGDWYKKILETPMDSLPGTKFNYSNAAPVLISGIIQIASKMNIDEFAKKYLFVPLDINKYWFWQGNGGPQQNGMALIALTSRDMAKLGLLYLQKGKWKNIQIISPEFVAKSTSSIVKKVEANGVYASYNYGYFWWSDPVWRIEPLKSNSNVYLARGAGGQNIIVYPDKEMVVVITAWNLQRPNKPQEIFDKYCK